MFAEHDKHYPSRSEQTSLSTAVANITKPVTKINFGPSIAQKRMLKGVVIRIFWRLSLLAFLTICDCKVT